MAGLMALASNMPSTSFGAPQENYGTSNPLQNYGGDGGGRYSGSWTDVTGAGTGQIPDATAHGLAGFYHPAILEMLRQSLPNRG